ncbi:MAG: O-antigen ligase family protein [Fimbriimonadaceae bacterium]|nr:O-antigen ligase family protein [Fimbriimonadaceae bacterium]QYK59455.1 MAG: O-antigen ligase family protein [Fimbriimonadaceae bacterium]
MTRPTLEQGLLALGLALAVVIGGQVALTPLPWPAGGWAEGALGGLELPLNARWLISLFLVVAFALAWFRHRIVQIPVLPVIGCLGVFCGLVLASVPQSAFPMASFQFGLEWLTYALALGAAVAVVGRGGGPRAMVWILVSAAVLVAAKGITEYAGMRAIEPTYRIFAGWNNPNALAGILVLASPLATGLAVTAQRAERFAAWACAALLAVALTLTQSKGGLACFFLAHGALFLLALVWRAGWGALSAFVAPCLALAFGGLLALTQPTATGPGPAFTRLAQAGQSQEQSAGFRVLLWRSAVELIRERPQGIGIGTFQFESTRPGLTPATYLAHQSWLQVTAETGWLGLVGLLALLGVAGRAALRRVASLPAPRRLVLAGVVSSLVGVGANGFVESNLYYFGTGVATFALIGVALLLGTDGVTPEMTPRPLRHILAAGVALLFFGGWSVLASSEVARSQALAGMADGKPAPPPSLVWDSEAWYLASVSSGTPELRLEHARQAARWQPSPRMLRYLARVQTSQGRTGEAAATLQQALKRDPCNLPALLQLAQLYDQEGDRAMAREFAARAVAVEQTTVFKTRAIPELIPIQTYDARLILAKDEPDPLERARLLAEACRGFLSFVTVTGPQIERFSRANAPQGFLGNTMETLAEVKEKAKGAGNEAAKIYRKLGKEEERSKLLEEMSVLGSD